MPIKVSCSCGKTLTAPDAAAGKKAKCPACGQIVPVPAVVQEVVQEAEAIGVEAQDRQTPLRRPPARSLPMLGTRRGALP